jgi:hypothetical protein
MLAMLNFISKIAVVVVNNLVLSTQYSYRACEALSCIVIMTLPVKPPVEKGTQAGYRHRPVFLFILCLSKMLQTC